MNKRDKRPLSRKKCKVCPKRRTNAIFFSIEKISDVPQEIIQPYAFIFRNEKTKLTVGLKDWPKIMISDETEI